MPAKTAATPRTAKATTVAEFLARAPADKRAALKTVRRAIRAAAPRAIEGLSYGLVGYKYRGRPLIYIGYAKEHCGLYGDVFGHLDPKELARYPHSRGTLRFPASDPIPARLVTKIVKGRMREIDAAS